MIRLTGCFVALLFTLCKPLGAQLNETYASTTNLYIVLVKFRDSEPHGWSGDPPSHTSEAYKTQDFERLFGAAGPSQGFGPTEDVCNIPGQRLATFVEAEPLSRCISPWPGDEPTTDSVPKRERSLQ